MLGKYSDKPLVNSQKKMLDRFKGSVRGRGLENISITWVYLSILKSLTGVKMPFMSFWGMSFDGDRSNVWNGILDFFRAKAKSRIVLLRAAFPVMSAMMVIPLHGIIGCEVALRRKNFLFLLFTIWRNK